MSDDGNLQVLVTELLPPPGYERMAEPPEQVMGPTVFVSRDEQRTTSASLETTTTYGQRRRSEAFLRRRLASQSDRNPTTEAVVRQTRAPISAVGRIRTRFGDRIRYCTGTVVAEATVLTAAHCVYARAAGDRGIPTYADNVEFEPQFGKRETVGQWSAVRIYMLKGWVSPELDTDSSPFDLALLRLDSPIAETTGIADVRLGPLRDGSTVISLGYPREPVGRFRFDGQSLYATTGRVTSSGSLGVIAAANELTEGSSGGPWFVQAADTGRITLTGVNSKKPVDGDRITWSPELAEGFEALFARVMADFTGV